jgi:type IV pilus assembly protein PilE
MKSNPPESTPQHVAGFTLVELMVVVTIVAILAAIAFPAYRSHVVKTQRSAAKACLSQYAQFMERHYTTQLTYVDAAPVLGCASEGNMPLHYAFSVTGLSATAYTAQAAPTAAFAARDTQCGTLTLNQLGVRGVSPGSVADCW